VDSKIPFIIRIKAFSKTLNKALVYFFVSIFNALTFRKFNKTKFDSQVEMQKEFDKKLVYSLSKSRFPTWKQFKYLKKYLSITEKRLMNLSIFLLISSLLFMGGRFYYTHLEITPVRGGQYTEALVGAPQTINPLFSGRNDVDDDLSQLIFSSLFKRGINGELNKDLVDDFFVSADSKIYEFTIKENVKWHDGSLLTVDDIIFTFNAILEPLYKSSLRQSFVGVKIEKIDDYNFRFLLTDPYAAFLDLLTFGIIPADNWSQIQPESATLATLNLKPIGSGPYKSEGYSKDDAGTIKEYKLVVNEDYYSKIPYLDLNFKFFLNFEEAISALNDNSVDGISYLPAEMKDLLLTPKSLQTYKLFFPQITLIFLNQQTNLALADKAVRQALAFAIDRRAIVNDVLDRDAYIVDSPILANSFAYNPDIKKYIHNKEKAVELLESVDWKIETVNTEMITEANKNIDSEDNDLRLKAKLLLAIGEGDWRKKNGKYLEIRLSTVERKENSEIIIAIKKYWEEIGVKVNIEVVPASRIQGEVIRPRKFEALFYAQVLGSDPDPYAFWHSSQAEHGFNIADYSNKEVDQLLEDARLTAETSVRQAKYKIFQELIAEDEPAIFMYSPHYTYIQDLKIKGFDVQNILVPKDRFANISDWYLKTGKKVNWKK